MSLYQKHRPVKFADMTGQKHVSSTLQNAIKLDLVAHAYLFCGPRGTGKTTTARILSKAINCLDYDSKNMEPCNKCHACKSISESSVLDVVEIDAASNRGIDEIRLLKENVNFAPTQVKNKVYIIDEVHMLTNEAFNALLKTLEEPPSNVFFILATTEAHKIPDTIISRCQKFNFERLSVCDIVSRLEYICEFEKIEFNPDGLNMIAEISKGGMRDSISMLDQIHSMGPVTLENVTSALGKTEANTFEKLFGLMQESKTKDALDMLNKIYISGFSLMQFSEDFMLFLRDEMYNKIEKDLNSALKISELISLFYDLKQRFNDSGLIKSTLEVFIIQGIAVLVSSLKTADSSFQTDSLRLQEGGASAIDSTSVAMPPTVSKADKAMQKELATSIDNLKEQVRSMQTLIDKHGVDIQTQNSHIQQLTSKAKPSKEVDSAQQLTPMLDSALKMIEEDIKNEAEAKKVKIYSNNFDLEKAQKLYKKWHAHIQTSAVKRALNQAKLSKLDNQTLGLGFTSNFFIKTLDKPEIIDEIERAIAVEYELIKVKPILEASSGSTATGIKNTDPFALSADEQALRKTAVSEAPLNTEEDLADFFDGEVA